MERDKRKGKRKNRGLGSFLPTMHDASALGMRIYSERVEGHVWSSVKLGFDSFATSRGTFKIFYLSNYQGNWIINRDGGNPESEKTYASMRNYSKMNTFQEEMSGSRGERMVGRSGEGNAKDDLREPGRNKDEKWEGRHGELVVARHVSTRSRARRSCAK